ncbi:MAG: DUF2911 domain-containing protein [Terrimonas sp.]|nr:DUF2911 domain-containing protein [Terrimonas sp.]
MKSITVLLLSGLFMMTACGQKPPASPPASVKETLNSGVTVSINYSQPSVKGRTIGKDLEPMAGKVWRTGANEATVFEVDKDVKVEGQALPAGKYGLFTLMGEDGTWTIIFNKTWKQWGAFNYKEADDALRVNVKGGKGDFSEKMTFTIDKSGKVSLAWGDHLVSFMVN